MVAGQALAWEPFLPPRSSSSKAPASAHLDAVHVWLDVALRFQVQYMHRGQQGLVRAKGRRLHALQDGLACLGPARLLCLSEAMDGLHREPRSSQECLRGNGDTGPAGGIAGCKRLVFPEDRRPQPQLTALVLFTP